MNIYNTANQINRTIPQNDNNNSNSTSDNIESLQALSAFQQMILSPTFPCIGAKASFHFGSYIFRLFPEMNSMEAVERCCIDLKIFIEEQAPSIWKVQGNFATFVCAFAGPKKSNNTSNSNNNNNTTSNNRNELAKEHLRSMNEYITGKKNQSLPRVPVEPTEEEEEGVVPSSQLNSRLEFYGVGFFLPGLNYDGKDHILSQFDWPLLVFNPLSQFK